MQPTRDRSLQRFLQDSGEAEQWDWSRSPVQESFMVAPETFTCFSGGFGCGKTTVLCGKTILLSTSIPNNLGYMGRLDGKALKQTTLQVLLEMLPKEYIKRKNDQAGFLQLIPEVGGGKLVYGDFKDLYDLKNHPLGFYCIDQMEEVSEEVWKFLAGRIRRKTAIRNADGFKQYYVIGTCNANLTLANRRHYALEGDRVCRLCQHKLPKYSEVMEPGCDFAPWELIIYNRYGFGVCNPEGPSHWIYKYFSGLPSQHGTSVGRADYKGFHATIYDGLHAGFVDQKYVKNLEVLYGQDKQMWDRYLLGKWVEAEGLVYPMWNRGRHIIDHRTTRFDGSPLIDPSGKLFEYIDHGLNSATAVGWIYTEHCTCGCGRDNFYLIDEHYEGGRVVSYHAAQIKSHRLRHQDLVIQATYLDSQAFSKSLMGVKGTARENELYSVADEYMDYDIFTVPTQKDWKIGHNRLGELLVLDERHQNPITGEMGAPHLLVFDTVTHFIEEIEGHKWKKVKNALEQHSDEPADGKDHHMDGMRNFLSSRPTEYIEFRTNDDDREAWLEKELSLWENHSSSHMAA